MNKQGELSNPTSCLNKAKADEPLFVLRAKDPYAPMAVRHWAAMAYGHHEPEKVKEALALADEMEAWRKRNVALPVADAPPE